jgi:hypothetical protein
MSCTALTTITKSCDNNSGGLLTAWVVPQDNFTGKTVDTNAWEVTALTNDVAFTPIEFKRNTASYTDELQQNRENGSDYYMATITFKFHRREGAKSRALKILGEGQRYLTFIVGDANGKYFLFENMQLATNAGGSGVARGDGSNYDVTFNGDNDFLAYEVDSTLIPNLESVNS